MMMTIPQDQDEDLRSAYQAYSADHDRHREALMARIADETLTLKSNPPAPRTINRLRFVASLAAAVLVAIGVSMLIISPQPRAYGMEGLAERLIEVRSLYMSGVQFYEVVDQDGKQVWKSYPLEYYFERPNRSRINSFGLSYPGEHVPTVVRQWIVWTDNGIRGQKNIENGQITLTKSDPRLSELATEQQIQTMSFLALLTKDTHAFTKTGSEEKDGIQLDIYERTLASEFDNSHDKTQVWLNRSTGLPANLRMVSITEQGQQQETLRIDKIELNTHDAKDLFPATTNVVVQPAADGLQAIQSNGEELNYLGTWYALQLTDHRVLACWANNQAEETRADSAPKFIGTIGDDQTVIPTKTIHAFESGNHHWRWSLLQIPDTLNTASMDIRLQQQIDGTTTSFHIRPLRFPKERIETVLKNVQELTMQATDLPALTLDQVLKY
jgi:hypothetical protein